MIMEFFDLEDSGFLDGPFAEANAEAIGTFDKANGYVGAICDIGEISYIVSSMGSVDAVVSYLVAIAANYFKAYPGGLWAFSFNNQGASSTTGQQAAEIQKGVLAHVGIIASFYSLFKTCPSQILVVGAWHAGIDSSTLTCS